MSDRERQTLLRVLREAPGARDTLKMLVDQRRRERAANWRAQARERKPCLDCAAQIERLALRCRACENRHRTTNRRFDEQGALVEVRCARCREFKSVVEYAPSEIQSTSRSGSRRCRPCLTVIQRERRQRVREGQRGAA